MDKETRTILKAIRNRTHTYSTFLKDNSQRQAKILSQVLHNPDLTQNLARAYTESKIHRGGSFNTDFPVWAYRLAYILLDPEKNYNSSYKEAYFNLCATMLEEFHTGDQYITRKLNQKTEKGFTFLSEIAGTLLP